MTLYESLPEGSFRLLRLFPDRNTVVVGLSTILLSDDIPSFEALSYAWGTEAPTEQIHCLAYSAGPATEEREAVEPQSISVSLHLFEALRCLRATKFDGKRPRWLWIDALCIDQQNNDEKAIQVPLMSEIYSRAQRVVVWLGKSDAHSDNVMRRIPELAAKMSEIEDLRGVNFNTASSFGLPPGSDSEESIWYGLARWYDRDWFTRLWVLQEACLAKEMTFLCGTASLAFEDAAQFADLWSQTSMMGASKRYHKAPPGVDFLGSTAAAKSMASDEVGLPVYLYTTRSLECREIVDRIYGTLGMLPETTKRQIRVDYSEKNRRQPSKLFTHVGKLALEETSPLNRFMLFMFMSKPRMEETPSWLPGYMFPIEGQAIFMERAGLPKDSDSPFYDAQISTSLSPHPVSLRHPDNIKVGGMLIDEVADVVHLDWEWSYHDDEDNMNVRVQDANKFLDIEAWCAALTEKLGISPSSTTYCRTLVANRDIEKPGPYDIDEICEDYQEALSYFRVRQGGVEQLGLRPNRPRLHRYVSSMSEKWRSGRSFFTTTDMRIGIGGFRSELRTGDHVCIFFGAHQLFVLRDTSVHGLYTMVGDAYVHGLMDCEAFDLKDPQVHGQTFEIC